MRFLLLLLLITGCSYRVEKETTPDLAALFDPAKAGFAEVSSLVLQPKCVRCHSGMMGSYASLVSNLGEISRRVQDTGGDQMPPAGEEQLTTAQKALLLGWIARGAPEIATGTGNQQPPPVEAQPLNGFALVKKQVFDQRCVRCHSGLFGSYASVKDNIDEIAFRVQLRGEGQMPPVNRPQLSAEEQDLLLRWIALGAPEEGGVEEEPRSNP